MGLNLPEPSRGVLLARPPHHAPEPLLALPTATTLPKAMLIKMAASARARVTSCPHHRQAPSQSSVTYLPPNQPGVTGRGTQEAAQTLSGGNLFVNGHANP